MSEQAKCPGCGSKLHEHEHGVFTCYDCDESWSEQLLRAVSLERQLAAKDAEIERLRDGIRRIRDYHGSMHGMRLPGGTTRFCDFLLTTTKDKTDV